MIERNAGAHQNAGNNLNESPPTVAQHGSTANQLAKRAVIVHVAGQSFTLDLPRAAN